MVDLVEKTRAHFLKTLRKTDPRVLLYAYLPNHVAECGRWAKRILKDHPEADHEIVFLSVWLHDIGQAFKPKEEDHALKSERETRRFLAKHGLAQERIEKVAHCVRAHRNKDVIPELLEAKILAAADSTSHMTDFCYIDMVQHGEKENALAKKEEIMPLYKAWKELIRIFPFFDENFLGRKSGERTR